MDESTYAIPAQENVEIQCGGALGRHRTVLERRAGRHPLRADGVVVSAARLAIVSPSRFPRHILPPHRTHARQEVLLHHPRRERGRRKKRLATGLPLGNRAIIGVCIGI